MSDPVYIIGIDLGTTNSVVSYVKNEEITDRPPQINVLSIQQTVDAGVVEGRQMLPSFILVPGAHHVAENALDLPWEDDGVFTVGEFAKKEALKFPTA